MATRPSISSRRSARCTGVLALRLLGSSYPRELSRVLEVTHSLTSAPEGIENRGVARHLCAVMQCAALVVAFVGAPFWHVHPDHSLTHAADDHTPHHTGQTIHTHVATHVPPSHGGQDSFTACHPDETLALTTFLLEQVNTILAPAAVDEGSFVSLLPAAHAERFPLEEPRAHGPPPHRPGPSRAPPA